MSILQKLTEGVVNRDMRKEGSALLSKWEQTGLLEGLQTDVDKNNMAVFGDQAKQLLKGCFANAKRRVEGFAAVAFPIVRRVFGGLIANTSLVFSQCHFHLVLSFSWTLSSVVLTVRHHD